MAKSLLSDDPQKAQDAYHEIFESRTKNRLQSTMKKNLLIGLIFFMVAPPLCAKDFCVNLHTPSKAEMATLHDIFNQEDNLDEKCKNKPDADPEECLINIKWHVARVHLDDAPEAEFIIAGDGLGWNGLSYSPLVIYKKTKGKWTQIFDEDTTSHTLEIYAHRTNGFRDIRQISRRFIDSYNGSQYDCAQCLEDTARNDKINYLPGRDQKCP